LVQRSKALGVGPIMLGFFLFVVVGSGTPGCLRPYKQLPPPTADRLWHPLKRLPLDTLERTSSFPVMPLGMRLTQFPCCFAALLQIIRTATSGGILGMG